ncbi:MAG: type II toxin-antitoxin system VapC family toxin [Candidatus Sericytochromatia bacterium]|nr:type II toxin-antitoxin system VapC family toxin [Candidatus Tanganyikabacteria bacterium]
MARRSEAYVDTSALIALADRSDTFHPLFRRLFSNPPALVTTPLVVAEGHGWFLRRFDRYKALQFLARLESMTPLAILDIGRKDVSSAMIFQRRFSDQDLTLADAMGLHVMESRRNQVCWSTDRDMRLTGVPLIIDRA